MPRQRYNDDELDDDGEDEDEGFVRLDGEDGDEDEEPKRPKRRQSTAPEPVAEAAEVAQLRAEVARMSGEVARLRAAGGLEARRDEPATVGDVVDALEAQSAAIRAEIAELATRHGPRAADELAARVESRLLDGIEGIGDDEDDDEWDDEDEEREGEVSGGRGRKRKPNGEPVTVRAHQAYVDEDGQMRVARRAMELPPGARVLD